MTVTLHARVAWWVRPYVWIAAMNVRLGIPIDFPTVARTVASGVQLSIERSKSP